MEKKKKRVGNKQWKRVDSTQLDKALEVQQDVVTLDVAVNDVFAMQVSKTGNDLEKE